MQVKRRIKICYIFAIIVAVSNLMALILDFQQDLSVFWKVYDIVYLACAIICVIGFYIYNKKPMEFAIKHKKMFVFLVVISFISSLILGFIALLASFDLSTYIKIKQHKQEDNAIETTGEVIPTYDEIVNKIKTIDEMKKNNLITDEEYETLKKEILDSITKN